MDKHLKIMKMIFERVIIRVGAIDRNNVIINEMANVDWDHYDQLLNDDVFRVHEFDGDGGFKPANDILNAMNKMADEVRHDVVAMTFTDDEIQLIVFVLKHASVYGSGLHNQQIEALLKRFDR